MLIGGAGGAATGATSALITQVQFLNLYGRVGGSEGSAAMQTFSDGLGQIFSVAPFLPLHISMQAGKMTRDWM
jgi:hypothetical protein